MSFKAVFDVNNHNEVNRACKPASPRWRDLGGMLGVLESTLNIIEADHRLEGVERCMSAMISVWLRRPQGEVTDGVIPTWKNLCEALYPIDGALADKLAVEHGCISNSNFSNNPLVSEVTSRTGVALAFLPQSCGCGQCLVKESMWRSDGECQNVNGVLEIAKSFNAVSIDTWQCFECLDEKEILKMTSDLGVHLDQPFLIAASNLNSLQSQFHDLFVSWFNFGPLHFLAKQFLSPSNPNLMSSWNQYREDFKRYCSSTDLKAFANVFFLVEKQNIFSLEVDSGDKNLTLSDAEGIRDSLTHALDVPTMSINLVVVREGCQILYFCYRYADYLARFGSLLTPQRRKMIANIEPHKIQSLADLGDQFIYENIQRYKDSFDDDSANDKEETLKKKAQIDAAAVLLTKEAEIKCLEDELRKIQETHDSQTIELQLWKKQAIAKDFDLIKKDGEIQNLKDKCSEIEGKLVEAKFELKETKDTLSKKEGIIKEMMLSTEDKDTLCTECYQWTIDERIHGKVCQNIDCDWKPRLQVMNLSNALVNQIVDIDRMASLCSDTNTITEKFASVFATTMASLENKLVDEITVPNIVTRLAAWLKCRLPTLSNIDQLRHLFHLLHVSWFNISALHFLAKSFLSNCEKTMSCWSSYLTQLKDYFLRRNLEGLAKALSKSLHVENQSFFIEIDECYYNFNMSDIKALRKSLCIAIDSTTVSIHFVKVRSETVTVYCSQQSVCHSVDQDLLAVALIKSLERKNHNSHTEVTATNRVHEMPPEENIKNEVPASARDIIICIKDEYIMQFAYLKQLYKNDLEGITARLVSVSRLSKEVTNPTTFIDVHNAFYNGLWCVEKVDQVEEQCRIFFDAISDGSASHPIVRLKDKLKSVVQEKFNISLKF